KDFGDPSDLLRQFRGTQQEFVILGSLVLFIEAGKAVQERALHNDEVANVIAGEKQFGRPVRLEERVVAVAVFVDLVLVRIENLGAGHRIDGTNDFPYREIGELIVVVEESDVIAGGQTESLVGRGGDAAISRQGGDMNARVALCKIVQNSGQFRVVGAVIRQAELPIGIDLGGYGIHTLREYGYRGAIDRNDNTDARPHSEFLGFR